MGAKWIKLAVIYFIIGVGFGIYMHATIQLQWGATHAHINVVGWLTTAVIGVIYSVYPRAGNSSLGIAHFWTYHVGILILLLGMMFVYVGVPLFVLHLFVWTGGTLLAISVVLFILNVFTNVHHEHLEDHA